MILVNNAHQPIVQWLHIQIVPDSVHPFSNRYLRPSSPRIHPNPLKAMQEPQHVGHSKALGKSVDGQKPLLQLWHNLGVTSFSITLGYKIWSTYIDRGKPSVLPLRSVKPELFIGWCAYRASRCKETTAESCCQTCSWIFEGNIQRYPSMIPWW